MRITFMPEGITWDAEPGMTVLEAAACAGVAIDGNCSGAGTCGKCRVKIVSGSADECEDPHGKLSEEDIQSGIRLACCHHVTEDLVVELPDTYTTAARKRKLIRLPEGFTPDSGIRKVYLQIPETTLKESESDEDRIREALGDTEAEFTIAAYRKIPQILRERRDMTLTLRDGKVIDCEPGDCSSRCYGVAVDIGTTTVVVMLWDLATARSIAVDAFTNPQGPYGADVISRITYVMENKADNLGRLHDMLLSRINESIDTFEKENKIRRENIYRFTVVGNTTMSCIFAGVDPEQLSVSPFSPIYIDGITERAAAFGLRGNEMAECYLVSNIAGHVGSDITAGVITTDLMDRDEGHLFIDIGTNGELVASGNGKAVCCSTAAGPAFEGSSIRQGMRAAAGAIEKVTLSEEGVELGIIGDEIPIGICGSGIIDAVGELIRCKIVDKNGRLLPPDRLAKKGVPEKLIACVRSEDGVNDFVLYDGKGENPDVLITQKDIREVQLAKAAISAGFRIMMNVIGVTDESLSRISIAGAFGNYISKSSAINIGLLPKIPEEKIFSLGNSAGIGASMILLSRKFQKEAEDCVRSIEHIQLATEPEFQNEYMMAMRF